MKTILINKTIVILSSLPWKLIYIYSPQVTEIHDLDFNCWHQSIHMHCSVYIHANWVFSFEGSCQVLFEIVSMHQRPVSHEACFLSKCLSADLTSMILLFEMNCTDVSFHVGRCGKWGLTYLTHIITLQNIEFSHVTCLSVYWTKYWKPIYTYS